jgi:hypothetical protein
VPVVLAMRNVVSHHILHSPVGPFGLTICLRVEAGGHRQLDLGEVVKFLPKRAGEPDVAVGDKLAGEPVAAVDLVEVESCGLLVRHDGVGRDEDDRLRQLVDNHGDGVEAAAWG